MHRPPQPTGTASEPATAPRPRGHPDPYDPWSDMERRWPHVLIRREPMTGGRLGELHVQPDGRVVLTLRADSSAAQQRCTLAHEIVHLERGIPATTALRTARDRAVAEAREELAVEAESARRLIPPAALTAAVRARGVGADARQLADELNVDLATLLTRVATLTPAEWRAVADAAGTG